MYSPHKLQTQLNLITQQVYLTNPNLSKSSHPKIYQHTSNQIQKLNPYKNNLIKNQNQNKSKSPTLHNINIKDAQINKNKSNLLQPTIKPIISLQNLISCRRIRNSDTQNELTGRGNLKEKNEYKLNSYRNKSKNSNPSQILNNINTNQNVQDIKKQNKIANNNSKIQDSKVKSIYCGYKIQRQFKIDSFQHSFKPISQQQIKNPSYLMGSPSFSNILFEFKDLNHSSQINHSTQLSSCYQQFLKTPKNIQQSQQQINNSPTFKASHNKTFTKTTQYTDQNVDQDISKEDISKFSLKCIKVPMQRQQKIINDYRNQLQQIYNGNFKIQRKKINLKTTM